ncbi:hypothetical protein TEA_022086 [Camellia sinensis var. sinensis]|uniref:Methyltransferase domain-containing protein n=1 Tax=Camellia sinensis var. sinensis TaxID=542762 RepID=A0A4S4D6F0_CAMSN|nr:hypothetical protein TEA_022086 [Camellia sinensis var. sinensis]
MLAAGIDPMGSGTANTGYGTSSPGWCPSQGQSFGPWMWQCKMIDFVNSIAAKVELIAKSTSPQKVGGRLPIPFPNPAGHDVVAIACPERYVVGLDISDEAIKKAIELSSSLPNADYFTFLKEDFFTWRPTELFDLIFDYTFFCAIEPDMRSAWASQMRDLLKPDGELITLIYEEFLNPIGLKAVSIVDNELAIAPRKEVSMWSLLAVQNVCYRDLVRQLELRNDYREVWWQALPFSRTSLRQLGVPSNKASISSLPRKKTIEFYTLYSACQRVRHT